MNFVFEELSTKKNFVENWEMNGMGSNRFSISPLFNRMFILGCINKDFNSNIQTFEINDRPENYIISIGVHNDPHWWAGGEYSSNPNVTSLFEFVNEIYLKDLVDGGAYLLIDSSFEGYHQDWVFNFFHKECEKRNIPPTKIIFVTGNSIVEERYENWIKENPQQFRINPLPYSHFENDVFLTSQEMLSKNDLPTLEEQLKYKESNISNIKVFNNLNKKPREHRIWFYSKLFYNDLLSKGLVSMNQIPVSNRLYCNEFMDEKYVEEFVKTLPSLIYGVSNEIEDTGFYINRVNHKVCNDSWISVISEARFEDEEGTVFLSEKVFKPIASHHPFIIMGNKHSLKELKKLGYKTFSNWIDESYDELDNLERMDAIIEVLKDIDKIENKLEWFKSMEDVLKFNYQILKRNVTKLYPYAFNKIILIFRRDTKRLI
jgi:hypothetical protein